MSPLMVSGADKDVERCCMISGRGSGVSMGGVVGMGAAGGDDCIGEDDEEECGGVVVVIEWSARWSVIGVARLIWR